MGGHDPFDLDGAALLEEEREDRERSRRAQTENDIQWLMGGKRGRRVVFRLLEQAGVFRTSFNTNALQMAHSEGQRNIGLYLLSLIHQVCPEAYVQMLNEQNESNERDRDGTGVRTKRHS